MFNVIAWVRSQVCRHSHAARRAGRDRGASGARASGARASGAGDAVNG